MQSIGLRVQVKCLVGFDGLKWFGDVYPNGPGLLAS